MKPSRAIRKGLRFAEPFGLADRKNYLVTEYSPGFLQACAMGLYGLGMINGELEQIENLRVAWARGAGIYEDVCNTFVIHPIRDVEYTVADAVDDLFEHYKWPLEAIITWLKGEGL